MIYMTQNDVEALTQKVKVFLGPRMPLSVEMGHEAITRAIDFLTARCPQINDGDLPLFKELLFDGAVASTVLLVGYDTLFKTSSATVLSHGKWEWEQWKNRVGEFVRGLSYVGPPKVRLLMQEAGGNRGPVYSLGDK